MFVRNAYLQSRRAKVADQTDAPVIDEDDLYFFDDELDDELDQDFDDEEEEEEEDYDDF